MGNGPRLQGHHFHLPGEPAPRAGILFSSASINPYPPPSSFQPGARDPKHLWLTQQTDDSDDGGDDVKWLSAEVATDDNDETKGSWERLLEHIPKMLAFICMALREQRELLIHCENGISTSTAVIILYILIKRRMRIKVAMAHVATLRREAKLSRSMYRGLASLQEEIDRRKLDRLDQRLRNSAVLSIAF